MFEIPLIPTIIFGAFCFVILLILLKYKYPNSSSDNQYNYIAKKCLMTQNEFKFYTTLKQTVIGKYDVMTKVRLIDIVKINENTARRRIVAKNKVKSKHIDFMLIDPADGAIKYAIELDDYTHNYKNAQKNDDFKNILFEQIGIPLVRFDRSGVSAEEIVLRLSEVNIEKTVSV